jgi:hypothetical protein
MICGKCKREKEFNFDASNLKKLQARKWARCRDCRRKEHEGILIDKWHSTKRSAEKRGLEFSLTKDQFAEILSKPCAYGTWVHGITTHVGIDRKDSAVGYTFDNSVPCCGKHNMVKGNWFTYEQMLEIVNLHPLLRECGLGASRGKPKGNW